jgi:hypothetical protein
MERVDGNAAPDVSRLPGFLVDAILTPDGLVIGDDADGIGVHLEGVDIVTRGFVGDSRAGGCRNPGRSSLLVPLTPPALASRDAENNSQVHVA